MYKISKTTILTYLMTGAALAACNDESQDNSLSQEDALTRGVVFNIPLAAEDAVSTDLQIFLYDSKGTEKLGNVEIIGTEELEDGSQLVHGLIPLECEAIKDDMLQAHMVVLGNCAATDGDVESLQRLTFNANDARMPMFGSHNVQTRLDNRLEVLCPTTYLLRSGALVTVQLGDELKDAGIALKEATLLQGNKTGYCAPLHATKLNTASDLSVSYIFNPDASQKGNIALQSQANGAMEAFVPECKRPENGVIELNLEFLHNGESYSGIFGQTVYFKNYADNEPFDIVRGHHYIFTIRSLQTEGDVVVKVEDWTSKTAEDVIFN